MTRIEVKRNETGQIIECLVQGHTEYADAGEDLVCGAISMLSQTAILGLYEVAQQKMTYEIDPEGPRCYVQLLEPITDRSQAILETAVLGYKNLLMSYGEYIQISD